MPSRGESINIFSKNSFKSIYYNYILGNSIGEDRYILNSREKKMLLMNINEELESLNRVQHISDKYETATFEYRDQTTGLQILHKINTLTSINEQDIILWSQTFRELARMCNWNENAQLEVLRQIVSMNIQFSIGPPKNVDNYINLILRQKYNTENAYKYYDRLINIKQKDYYTIRKYLKEIESNCYKLGLCLSWDNSTIKFKTQESFFQGLEVRTKLELSKYLRHDFENVFNSILSTENMLIELLTRNDNYNTTDDNLIRNNRRQKPKYTHQTYNETKTSKDIRSKKYCSLHKSLTHSDEECLAQNKMKSQSRGPNHISKKMLDKNNDQNNKILSLSENQHQYHPLY
ncbi:hypothetical protein DMUE_3118 [Dictyocoela muelleri]|nr:hypothetical protein DMUE_3118 [Dictyocoela muelleri]